jgi:pimeloyl-ACP methyl ester carboxylesterase
MVYRNHPLDVKNDAITQVLVVIHGQGRDADNYYRHAVAAAFLADALDRTLVISPKFASSDGNCRDTLRGDEAGWRCEGPERWTSGGPAVGRADLTSFDYLDEIQRRVTRREVFPNLKAIVIAGHSAGGQYVTRYEMASRVHGKLGVPVTYVVANPSSYTYPDAMRPTASALPPEVAARAPGYTPGTPANPPAAFGEFFDAAGCSNYDQWPYGMQKRAGYTAGIADEELRRQLASRPVTYLLGELDILPLYGFDSSCAAMAQGPTRLARGLAYNRYLKEKLGASHKAVIVPACGHNARCMFGAEAALPVLFPKE